MPPLWGAFNAGSIERLKEFDDVYYVGSTRNDPQNRYTTATRAEMQYAKTKNMQLSETKLIRFFNSRSTRDIVNRQERGGNRGEGYVYVLLSSQSPADETPICNKAGCSRPAKEGRYGYCGLHHTARGKKRSRDE